MSESSRSLQHLDATADAAEVAEAVRADGAVIIDRLAPAELMANIASELDSFLQATPTGTDDFSGFATRRTGALIARSPSSRTLVQHPLILATAADVLSHSSSFQLHLTQAIAIGPGSPAQAIHRDQWAFDFFAFPRGYDVQLNTIWAMTPFTQDNGATRIVVGSNAEADGVAYGIDDTVAAEMDPGSVIVYSGSVYHGGGENRSDETRIGLNITYCLSWLRQEENQYLSVPMEVAKDLPTDLLRLMGYARGAYALGYLDDLRDPIEAIRPGDGADGFGDETAQEAATRAFKDR